MTRLWDKGAPLDEHVLAYTAGEDYALDERLVPYDARASIAHAEMLHAQKLLAASPTVKISGRLEYQACDDKVCYAPTRVPVSFTLTVQ